MTFSEAILAYPTVIYTTFLGVVLLYWALALIGLVDYESGGPDLDVDVDVDAGGDIAHNAHLLDGESGSNGIGTLASYLVALGLSGVPFSVVVSLLTLLGWVVCGMTTLWLFPIVPTNILRFVVGSAILAAAFALSIPLAAACVRPLRKLFITHNAISNTALVGHECVVLTGAVDEKFGRAEVPARGAGYHIRVVADTPNNLKRGNTAVILEYDESLRLYRIAEKEKP